MCLRRFVLGRVQRTATESSSKMILNIVPFIKVNVSSAKVQSRVVAASVQVCAGSRRGSRQKSELRLESQLESGSTKFPA